LLLIAAKIFLDSIFDELIDSFIKDKIGIADNFCSSVLLNNLRKNLLSLYAENAFKAAGTGDSKLVNYDAQFRGDEIYWLDRKNENEHEHKFFDLMDSFIVYLNQTCYVGITAYEFHYARYDTGTFYKKHMDQFNQNDSRKFSMIMYLNYDWEAADGGELCIHHQDKDAQHISPTMGKSVFFKSDELAHEVLVTHKPRLSITGWLKV
jgi:SM-20-related protein